MSIAQHESPLFSTLPASFASGAAKVVSVHRYITVSSVSLLPGENSFLKRPLHLHRPKHFYKCLHIRAHFKANVNM